MFCMTRLTPAVAGVLAITLVTAASPAVAAPAVEPPTATSVATSLPPDSLTATVRYVREHGIDVITGVQLALKLTYFVVDTAARLYGRGAPPALQAPYFADLEALARTLRMGDSAARVFLAA